LEREDVGDSQLASEAASEQVFMKAAVMCCLFYSVSIILTALDFYSEALDPSFT
jgi:hypothetical protein